MAAAAANRLAGMPPVRRAFSTVARFMTEPVVAVPKELGTQFRNMATPEKWVQKFAKKAYEPPAKQEIASMTQASISQEDADKLQRTGVTHGHFEARRRRRRRHPNGLLSVSELAALLCVPEQPCPYTQ